jgi:hypothetical protein
VVPEHGHGLGKVSFEVIVGWLGPPDWGRKRCVWKPSLKPKSKRGLTCTVPTVPFGPLTYIKPSVREKWMRIPIERNHPI